MSEGLVHIRGLRKLGGGGWESGSGDGIFMGMLVPLRFAATVYGFYEAGAHITLAVNRKQSAYLLLGSLILGKVKHGR